MADPGVARCWRSRRWSSRSAGRWPAAGWASPAAAGRHDAHSARPLAQHGRTAGLPQSASKLETGVAATRANARHARLGALGADRQRDARRRRSWSRRKRSCSRRRVAATQRGGRSAGAAASRPRLHPNQRTGQTEIWICSDLRANDWNADSGRWETLRDAFREFPQGVRFHLLAYPDGDAGNRGRARHRRASARDESTAPSCSCRSRCTAKAGRSKLNVPMQIRDRRGPVGSRRRHGRAGVRAEGPPHLRSKQDARTGWGRVSIPADENLADNEFYFVFSTRPSRDQRARCRERICDPAA